MQVEVAAGGYDPELFADLTDVRILEEFVCCICACLQLDAVNTSGCGHSFCRGCIDTWLGSGKNTCPLCRAPTPGPGQHNALRENLNVRRAIEALPVRCTDMVAAAQEEEGEGSHRCGWIGILGPRGETWCRHVMVEHKRANPLAPVVVVAPPVVVPVPDGDGLQQRRARWEERRAAAEAALPLWEWASRVDGDILTLPELARLLVHPDHPAHLSLARAVDDTPRMAYIHVWNERTQKFMRTTHHQTLDARNVSGLYHQERFYEWSVSVQLLDPADAAVWGGARGTLLRWMARELAQNYQLFFPAASPDYHGMLNRLSLEDRTTFVLEKCTLWQQQQRQRQMAVLANRPPPPPMLLLKIESDRRRNLPLVHIFQQVNGELSPPLYSAAIVERDNENAPDPRQLVRSLEQQDTDWTLLGLYLGHPDNRWSLVNRCTAIHVKPAAAALAPRFNFRVDPIPAAAAAKPSNS